MYLHQVLRKNVDLSYFCEVLEAFHKPLEAIIEFLVDWHLAHAVSRHLPLVLLIVGHINKLQLFARLALGPVCFILPDRRIHQVFHLFEIHWLLSEDLGILTVKGRVRRDHFAYRRCESRPLFVWRLLHGLIVVRFRHIRRVNFSLQHLRQLALRLLQ